MLPSRGIRLNLRHFQPPRIRQHSSYGQASRRQWGNSRIFSSPSRVLEARVGLAVTFLPFSPRFQSTATATPSHTPAPTPASTPASTPTPTPDSAVEVASSSTPSPSTNGTFFEQLPDLSAVAEKMKDIEPHIGYLKELGLDFGWGPSASMQWALEHVHVYLETPWWASIVITTVAMRLIMFRWFMTQSNEMAKMSSMAPLLQPIKDRYTAASMTGDKSASLRLSQEMRQLNKAFDVKYSRMFAPAIVQGFFGFGAFWLTRHMAELPVPGLSDGGFLWLTDLTVADPYFIFPLAIGGTLHLLARFRSQNAMSNEQAKLMLPIMTWVLPGLSMVICAFLPGAVQLVFVTNTVLAVIQSSLFQIPGFRRRFGMLPLPKPQGGNRPGFGGGGSGVGGGKAVPSKGFAAGAARSSNPRLPATVTVHGQAKPAPVGAGAATATAAGPKADASARTSGVKEESWWGTAKSQMRKTMDQARATRDKNVAKDNASARSKDYLDKARAYEKRRRADIQREQDMRRY